MKNFLKHAVSIVVGVSFVVAFAIFVQGKPADASVTFGNDYRSIEITSANASTTPIILRATPGSFGSIIVASSSLAGNVGVYDNAQATSSATSTRLVKFTSLDTVGTYTFDISITRGLILDVPVGFTGDYVVTYR